MKHRIRLLPKDFGRTLFDSGIVLLSETIDGVKTSNVDQENEIFNLREREYIITFTHENIHYIQSFTSPYLIDRSKRILALVGMAINKLKSGEPIDEEISKFFVERGSLFEVDNNIGISIASLVEGVAVLESFRLTHSGYDILDFLHFRDEYFPEKASNEIYRQSFDLLSGKIGTESTINLLSPFSYLALCTDKPIEVFNHIVRNIDKDRVRELYTKSLHDIAALFGFDLREHIIYHRHNSNEVESICEIPISFVTKEISPYFLIEVAARPILINQFEKIGINPGLLNPPITIYSKSLIGDFSFRPGGIGAQENSGDYLHLLFEITGTIGVLEAIVDKTYGQKTYHFCPNIDCPYHETNLCAKWYKAPTKIKGYEHCDFPSTFITLFGLDPNEFFSKYFAG